MPSAPSPHAVGAQIEGLLDDLARGDPGVRDASEELVRLLAQLYGEGLAHVVASLRDAGPGGEAQLDRLVQDDLVSALLALHGLHPLDVHERVTRALDQVRPYLGSHAGGVEFLGIEKGVARLRLEGSCHGCPSSLVTVRDAIERALEDVAPELAGVEVEGVTDPEVAGDAGPLLQIEPSPYRNLPCPVPAGQV